MVLNFILVGCPWFFVLARSVFFGIFTHGHSFQNTRCPAVGNSHCTFTKIFLGICWVYSICMQNYKESAFLTDILQRCSSDLQTTWNRRVPFNFRCNTIHDTAMTRRTAKIGQEGSTVASTSSPKQYLKSLEFSKQLPDVFTQIQWDISCKLDVNFRLPGI